MGFDAFGIHSENYALKVGRHPMQLIPQNIENFRRQLRRVGLMVDWKHELSTTDPTYYKWTQWIFLQLLQAAASPIRRRRRSTGARTCKTVLANEQVRSGCASGAARASSSGCSSSGSSASRDYAERLLDNLEWIDWSEVHQERAAQLDRPLGGRGDRLRARRERSPTPVVRVFTTRPDTIFGATYMVLAPEHPLVAALTTPDAARRGRGLSRARGASRTS